MIGSVEGREGAWEDRASHIVSRLLRGRSRVKYSPACIPSQSPRRLQLKSGVMYGVVL